MKTKRIFDLDTDTILKRGLNAMTIACDSLTKANEELNAEVTRLRGEIERLKERVITDSIEKE